MVRRFRCPVGPPFILARYERSNRTPCVCAHRTREAHNSMSFLALTRGLRAAEPRSVDFTSSWCVAEGDETVCFCLDRDNHCIVEYASRCRTILSKLGGVCARLCCSEDGIFEVKSKFCLSSGGDLHTCCCAGLGSYIHHQTFDCHWYMTTQRGSNCLRLSMRSCSPMYYKSCTFNIITHG